ncbi:MAG TPA: tRNA dihydrouridine(20/20a) synthase DusA [Burkholderiales bacterium]|nr:tRNA dihydrouridine(20/20a) synthase DusA [Burkholderiales bacterium]
MLSIAPMMGLTDRHERFFLRLITRHALLYTEMITANALIYGDVSRLLQHDPREQPVSLQIGGSDPELLSQSALIAEKYGYTEINLNIGCPSDRVQMGKFGACLMAEPGLVAECVAAMSSVVSMEVTVKTRIGIDHHDDYEFLQAFVEKVSKSGCQTFIIHARKALLNGLSPKQNREIPPLNYEVVRRLKADFPELKIILNGGIKSLEQASLQLDGVDGVMIGRAAYENPYMLVEADRLFYGKNALVKSRREIFESYLHYVEEQLLAGVALSRMTRHVLGLYQGCRGAGAYRRYLSEHCFQPGVGIDTLYTALSRVEDSPGNSA